MSIFSQVVSFIANCVQIIFGVSALYIAWTQRKKISAAFSILFNYSFRTSLADLRHWLEKLHEANLDDPLESKKVRASLAYISGKIRGNSILYNHFGDKMLKRINVMIDDLDKGNVVLETRKIALCSEIKENISTLEVENQAYNTKSHG